jgi:AcrR family transcriptional regulator
MTGTSRRRPAIATTMNRRREKRPVVRPGRPPRARVGEVDGRILDAARRIFLERGLGGASIDEIARRARAGKPTIYARFPTKEALFEAVVMRNAARVRARFESYAVTGATLEKRLVSLGTNILDGFLVADVIDFMRLSAAEVRRFPALTNVGRMARESGSRAVVEALRGMAQPHEIAIYPALAPERLETTGQFFNDLVVARPLMRALFGEDVTRLRAEIPAHVRGGVAFFLAACRRGGPAN